MIILINKILLYLPFVIIKITCFYREQGEFHGSTNVDPMNLPFQYLTKYFKKKIVRNTSLVIHIFER